MTPEQHFRALRKSNRWDRTAMPTLPIAPASQPIGGGAAPRQRWMFVAVAAAAVLLAVGGLVVSLAGVPRTPLLGGVAHPALSASASPTPDPTATAAPAPSTRATRVAAAAPTDSGCARTSAITPPGSVSEPIGDVDGDGRTDTGWARTSSDGSITFGITTASGATVSASMESAGGGNRTVAIGTLENGVTIALPSDERSAPLWAFADCHFVQPKGLNGADYTFDEGVTGSGTGAGCIDGRLVGFQMTRVGRGEYTVTATRVDVTADGLHATNGATSTIASNVDASSAAAQTALSVTCGSASLLIPAATEAAATPTPPVPGAPCDLSEITASVDEHSTTSTADGASVSIDLRNAGTTSCYLGGHVSLTGVETDGGKKVPLPFAQHAATRGAAGQLAPGGTGLIVATIVASANDCAATSANYSQLIIDIGSGAGTSLAFPAQLGLTGCYGEVDDAAVIQ